MSQQNGRKRQRGQIQARGEGRWLVRVFLGKDPLTGKRKYASETVRGTRRDAEKGLTALLAKVDAGEFSKPSTETLGAFLKEWLHTVAKASVGERTHRDYTSYLNRHVIPRIGDLALKEVTPRVIQNLYSDMHDGGYSPNTIRLVHVPLRQALQVAVDWKLIPYNPAVGTKRPKIRKVERQTLTVQQIDLFLEAYREDRLIALWTLMMFSGLGPGEALALKWEDLSDTTITVQRALTEVEKGKFRVGPPKTESRYRTITLPKVALDALERHRERQEVEKEEAGDAYRDDRFIFATRTGSFANPYVISARWRVLIQRLKLPEIRLYDLRHTHATLLLTSGVHPKIVSERLGHGSTKITMDTYSHVLKEVEAGVADVLDKALSEARKAA